MSLMQVQTMEIEKSYTERPVLLVFFKEII